MSNMIKMRNVGAQTQKKSRPGGPTPEGWGLEEWGPEGSGAQRGGAQTWKKLGPQGLGSQGRGPEGWGPEGWGPEGWAQHFALFFPLPLPFPLFFSVSGGLLVEFWWCLKAGTLKCARMQFSHCREKPGQKRRKEKSHKNQKKR